MSAFASAPGEAWTDVVARLDRASAALEFPRSEIEAVPAEHGAEVAAWVEGQEIGSDSFTSFSRFCYERALLHGWG